MHLLKALSEKGVSFYGGGVIYCRELSDSVKNARIHWLAIFKLLEFQGEEIIVLHSDWEAPLWSGTYKKLIKFITVSCIEDRIQCSWRKQARKLFLRRMRTAELLRSYPRRVWAWFQVHQGLCYFEYRHGWEGRGGCSPAYTLQTPCGNTAELHAHP